MRGFVGSFLLHALIALVFIVPYVVHEFVGGERSTGGGGPGPAGGGGGGTGGTGGTGGSAFETLYYVPIGPPAAAPEAAETPPAEARPVPLPPPEEPDRPEDTPEPTPTPVTPPTPAPNVTTSGTATGASGVDASLVAGVGGGSGTDGSAGMGPGSGGGVGSGIGTGRGSGIGPGTGGGPDSIYPPTLVTLMLPPLEAPPKVRPYTLVAWFDVDERGNTKLLGFNETSDSRFNRRVREVLSEVRFRPAVRGDGRPVRDTGRFEIEYP